MTLGSGGAINDIILSGAAHFGAGGVTPVMSLWGKALGTRNEVRSCIAIIAAPILMLTRDPRLNSSKDLSDRFSECGWVPYQQDKLGLTAGRIFETDAAWFDVRDVAGWLRAMALRASQIHLVQLPRLDTDLQLPFHMS